MDLNFVLAREQLERALGRAAIGSSGREAHEAKAARYRLMADRHRRARHAHVDGSTILPTGPRPA